MKLSINPKNLQTILEGKECKESIAFCGEVKDDTLHLQETYSGGSVFWPLAKGLIDKSTGYVKYMEEKIILCGVANKQNYEFVLKEIILK
ncbi:MAG: hypothetical protein PHF86_12795 [Candidatus Nanoarchaeia archaeon]|nr:hypothetical protein [Candidatus Nanoarchaeia archaeon]